MLVQVAGYTDSHSFFVVRFYKAREPRSDNRLFHLGNFFKEVSAVGISEAVLSPSEKNRPPVPESACYPRYHVSAGPDELLLFSGPGKVYLPGYAPRLCQKKPVELKTALVWVCPWATSPAFRPKRLLCLLPSNPSPFFIYSTTSPSLQMKGLIKSSSLIIFVILLEESPITFGSRLA